MELPLDIPSRWVYTHIMNRKKIDQSLKTIARLENEIGKSDREIDILLQAKIETLKNLQTLIQIEEKTL